MKTIEILISPNGQSRLQTHGFAGSQCREASQFLEAALGQKGSEQFTAEFYHNSIEQQASQQERQ